MSRTKKALVSGLVAVALVLVVGVVPSAACGGGGGTAWIVFHGDGTAWVFIHNVRLVDQQMNICAVGVNEIPGVAGIHSAGFVDPKTGAAFDALQFRPSGAVSELLEKVGPVLGAGIEGLPSVTDWQGFIGFVEGEIPKGTVVDLMFDVELDPRVDHAEFVRSFNNVGLFVTGGLTEDGLPQEGHFEIRRPMEIETMEEGGPAVTKQ